MVISGPSGVGKDAVLSRLKKSEPQMRFITTLTTRPRRPGEKDGLDYHFIDPSEFQDLLKSKGLLESAKVYNNWYGVPKQPIRDALQEGKDTVVKVDVQGAASIKRILPEAILIFLMPPSLAELAKRLTQRYTEKPPDLAVRLKAAESELEQISIFDYVVVNNNGGLESAVADIRTIIRAEKSHVKPRQINLP